MRNKFNCGDEQQLEQRLHEVFNVLWDDFIDPREAYTDFDGQWWTPVGGAGGKSRDTFPGAVSEQQLRELRSQCRHLTLTNEFATSGLENRVSYIVGPGHSYRATVRKGLDVPSKMALPVQEILDEFQHENGWQQRQQEIVRRMDRDGEAFLRLFADGAGLTQVRFVEPDQVATPAEQLADPSSSFGIKTAPNDVETVIGYYIDGELIDARQVQHRKANVDSNVKRGLPLYTPVRKNLRRAEKLLRNMSIVAEIQSAIALIRKHRGASRHGIEQFVATNADGSVAGSQGGVRHYSQYGPGTILDAPAGLEYDFPTAGVDAASFVAILKAELRAIAARLVMPEFMFSSDASSSNYASTMVAEGPAVRLFARLQAAMIEHDCAVFWRVIENAAEAGRLPTDVRRFVDLQITPPSLHVRDQLQEAQVNRIAFTHGILSAQTWSQRLGLDYDQEQKNRNMHAASP